MNWEAVLSGLTLLFYAVSSVQYHTHLFAGAEKSSRNAWISSLAGLSAHTAALGVWCTTHHWSILADERMPFSLVAYVLVVFQIVATSRKGWAALGSLSLPLAFIAQSYAVTPASQSAGGFSSVLLRPHVLVLLLGFAALTVAFCLAVLYLLQTRLLKTKQIRGLFRRLPPLDSVSTAAHRSAILGFTLLTLGMITGALVAPDAWGPRWYLDPHIATGLVAWVIYAAYLGASTLLGWRGRRTTYFLIAGFLVVLVAFISSVNRPRPERPSATSGRPEPSAVVASAPARQRL
ncbi:MAG: cytochrome C assembly family protein [Actinomycetota bacterium]